MVVVAAAATPSVVEDSLSEPAALREENSSNTHHLPFLLTCYSISSALSGVENHELSE